MSDQKPSNPGPKAEDKYELLLELGRGGMGVANLAVARGPSGFAKLVVLKTMRRQLVGDAESHRMFLDEARISARLTHPNIVGVYEVTEYDHAPTLVMEYLEGQTLWQVLRTAGDALPLPLHLHILTKVLSGLHAAHELRDYNGAPLNLIHRDVSPHNVCVLFDGQVKVLDFGIAKISTSEVDTRAGEFKGKVRYMPPEQMGRSDQDRRVDVFAVGVMLWEAIMRRRYWGEMSEADVIAHLQARQVPPLPPAGRNVPHHLRFICAQALAADPNDRYPTAGEFQRALEDYLLAEPERAMVEDELAAFMTRHFDAERATARAIIEKHLQDVKAHGGRRRRTGEATAPRMPLMPTADPVKSDADTRVIAAEGKQQDDDASQADRADKPDKKDAPARPPPSAGARPTASRTAAAEASRVPTPTSHPYRTGRRPARPYRSFFASMLVGMSVVAVATLALFGFTGRAIVDATQARAPAPGCAPGLKSCGGQCVSLDDPAYGCGAATCEPCGLPSATARCNRHGACDVAHCHAGFDDCDADGKNGCETNVRIDPDHCTSCERRCPTLPHAQRGCGDACTIWRCEPGFHDCNGAASDGCEVAGACR